MPLQTIQRLDNQSIQWVGQPLIFAFSNDAVVSGVPTQYFNVKFVAEIFIAGDTINTSVTTDLIATVKVVPNNEGVGIFNLRSVVESYVKPQRNGYEDSTAASKYKGVSYDSDPHPIHVIDKWCQNDVGYKEMRCRFTIEAATYVGGPVLTIGTFGSAVTTSEIFLQNAYVPTETRYARYQNPIRYYNQMQSGNGADDYYQYWPYSFVMSNAPLIQYANRYDYGVFQALSSYPSSGMVILESYISWRSRTGATSVFTTPNTAANGGATPTTKTKTQMVSVGAFPANLMEQNAAFKTAILADNVEYYDIKLRGGSGSVATHTYRIIINCPKTNDAFTTRGDAKGYTPIRLCWLNSLGAWDYYTFTMKSINKFKTKKTKYQQLEGTWNKSYYEIQGWKGGQKDYRVNTTENVVMNSDFMSEDDAEWFEFLLNSTEVYIMEQRDFNNNQSNNTNTWMRPVTLKTSSFTRKTIANDKLIQYTIEVEKSRVQNNQNA
jgi:hypothetical protein